MSRPYGSFSRHGNQRRNEHGGKAENTQSGSSRFEHEGRGSGGGQGRHPPWLKGKEIGLYYRDRVKAKRAQTEAQIITLPENVQHKLERVLNSKGFYEKLYNSQEQAENTNRKLEERYSYIQDAQFKRKFLNIVSGNIQENICKALLQSSRLERNSNLDDTLLAEYRSKISSEEYESMLKFRLRLPAYQERSKILKLIKENQVVVISGETGCGKTTQIAQFILDDQIEQGNGSITRIVCTQPRRISAISVAERVAAERTERLGTSIGFQIRLERVMPRDRGSITFCTSGMLLKFMESDPALNNYSHIILDEIHERTTEIDFTMALLKLIMSKRPDLKVLLMSATLNSESFSKYYNDCPIIHIPGFTYPVEEFYLEDVLEITRFKFSKHIDKYKQAQRDESSSIIDSYIRRLAIEKKYSKNVIDQLKNPNREDLSLDLIEELIRHICRTKPPGAILVFLPGVMDISQLHKIMMRNGQYPPNKYVIYPLHSRMPTVHQKLIFKEPPNDIRKIIIATSIAEASITIEDVVYVIDSGKMKYLKFDLSRNVETLKPEWVSLANSKQRRGRAGRVKPGICYHLYSRARESMLDQYPLPEMLITRLEEVILRIKILQLGDVQSFLCHVMDPPSSAAIELSLKLLRQLKALDDQENLTPLGYHLAQLPLDPRTGKMIIWAALFSCVEPVFAIAASLSFKDAFYCPLEDEATARLRKLELGLNECSDHIALAEALRRFENCYKKGDAGHFCREYFLSFNTLKLLSEMKSQFAQHLCEMKFLESENPSDRNANRNSDNVALVKAIVCAGLYPNIATVSKVTRGGIRAWTPEDGSVVIHPSSINAKLFSSHPSRYITYFTKQRSTSTYLHDTTFITTPILLFAASLKNIQKEGKNHVINLTCSTSKSITCDLRTAQIIQKLHEEFNNLITYKLTHPGTTSWDTYEGDLLHAIIDLVNQKDTTVGFPETRDEGG
ncbi:ATP-dependent DNA/RNA helicase DHX36 isoform X2 [Lasioglossum baleicum]|uniref:ATP-dependent DNA/RNA helicase DHX36 isoform X2 n=1 Tax=Lasioglossum baleicum TaxID=434251 RepID=UPI003FCD3743